MLRIITARIGETIIIGDIEATIKMVIGHQVWIDIKAPSDVPVYRKKAYQRIKNKNATEFM